MDVKKLLSKMTLREKLAQMSQYMASIVMPDKDGLITGPALALNLTENDVFSVGSILGTQGAKTLGEIQNKHLEKDPNKIPMLFMADIIHGHSTIYPIPLGMGATFDPELLERCASMSAKESAVSGLHVTFNPMVDLVRDARWGRVMETTGEDPYLNCLMAKANVKGYQGNGGKYNISACVKHFACYGGAEAGRDYNTVDISERTFRDYYMPAYKSAVDAGVDMVMTSFNSVNGVPATASVRLLKDILRNEWGFKGVVITDFNAIKELIEHGYASDDKDCAKKSLLAGCDIEMMSACFINYGEELVKEGIISEKLIDESTLRILELKNKLGLFENPMRSASEEEEKKYIFCEEHRTLCREASEKSAVLLKNDGVLPLSTNLKKIAIIGPHSKSVMLGGWSAFGKKQGGVSVYEGIEKACYSEIIYEKGAEGYKNELPNYELITNAVKVAKSVDAVILCVGEPSDESGESQSKVDISLSPQQTQLIKQVVKANKNTVVVLFNGRPLVLSNIIEEVPCIFTMWQPGSEGGNAVANLIFGKVNFEGRLPMTFPRAVGQCPIYYNAYNTGRPNIKDSKDAIFTSHYIDCENSPLFPFGYGLSYTNYSITPCSLSSNCITRKEKVTASVKVKNVGGVDGTTTLQLYIHDKEASLVRPIKELKGIKKVFLKAGEEKQVSFTIDESTLTFFTINNKFEAENGEFEIFIGLDSTVQDFALLTLK